VIPSGRDTKTANRPSRRRSRESESRTTHRPAPASKATTDAAHTGDDNPLPLLTPGLTPSQQQEYRNSTTNLLNQARRDLNVLNGRNLNTEQVATRTQASEWVRQAQIALNQGDLVRAQNLARKAAVLTRALFEQTQ
jgi:hypothetical protein